MLTDYIKTAMDSADYEKLEDGAYYGEIPGLQGVWGDGETLEACLRTLEEVLEDWLILKISDNDPIGNPTGNLEQ